QRARRDPRFLRRRRQRGEKRLGQSGTGDRRGARPRRESVRHCRQGRWLHEARRGRVRRHTHCLSRPHHAAHGSALRCRLAPACQSSIIKGGADQVGVGAIEETTPLERLTAAAVIGLMAWIGVNWILALTHTLTRPFLLVVLAIFVVAAIVAVWKNPPKA